MDEEIKQRWKEIGLLALLLVALALTAFTLYSVLWS